MSNSVESSWVDELIQNSHDCGACVPDRASAEPTEMMVKLDLCDYGRQDFVHEFSAEKGLFAAGLKKQRRQNRHSITYGPPRLQGGLSGSAADQSASTYPASKGLLPAMMEIRALRSS